MKRLKTFASGIKILSQILGILAVFSIVVSAPADLAAYTNNNKWLWLYSIHLLIFVYLIGAAYETERQDSLKWPFE